MGFFKRLCLFVFGLGGLLALAALVLPWYGPWTREATALLGVDEYYMAVEVVVLIDAVGCLACLLYSIFKRNRKTVVVARSGGDQITVARDAIASQATHVIEEDGTFRARRVSVSAKKRGHVRVYARVQPQTTVDVVAMGQDLHDRLVAGLTTVCGDNVDSVDLEFTNAAEYAPAEDAADLSAVGYDTPQVTAPEVTVAPATTAVPEGAGAVQIAPSAVQTTGYPYTSAADDGVADGEQPEAPVEPATASGAEPVAEGTAQDAQSGSDAKVEGSEITVPMAHYSAGGDDSADKE